MNGLPPIATTDRPVALAQADALPPLDPNYFDIGKIVIGPIRFSDDAGSAWIFSRCGIGMGDALCVDGITRNGGILSLGLGKPTPPPAQGAQWRGLVFDQTVGEAYGLRSSPLSEEDQQRLKQLLSDPTIRPQRLAYTKAVAPPPKINVVLPRRPVATD